MTPRLIWSPSHEAIASSRLADYTRWLDRDFESYDELWNWSVADPEGFWGSIWDYFGVSASKPYERVLASRLMPGAQWFSGAYLSFAEHVFRHRPDHAIAIVEASELRTQREVTWLELRAMTAQIRAGLLAQGVSQGDRVVAYMPNIVETVAAFLACSSLGAIWSSCAPEFGVRSALDRFGQIKPTVLLAVDGYRYGGKGFDRRDAVAELRRAIPSLQATFVLPDLGGEGNWDELLQAGPLEFEQLPFDHPLWVLYSSGTTGLPKAIVHGQGGILLEFLKVLNLHLDLRVGDRFFWFTTTGWMMWNFLVGGLLTGATIVLYDGSPAEPDLARLWTLAETAGISCFGTSAAYLNACMKAAIEPRRGRDLARLRSVGSTGSPLSREGFRWVYDHVGRDTWLFSTSGGTDVCTAFIGGVPTLPVCEGELQARALGAKVEAYDEYGRPLVGKIGELVLTEPLPSMPLFFWNDPNSSRYHSSYFDTYPEVWRYGDWIEISERGTVVIHGRSDSTINRDGIRIGTAEIYRAVLACDAVIDALAIDIPRTGTNGWIALFVVLRDACPLEGDLEREIRERIRRDCSPRHVPDEIRAVPDVPRTLSGKLLEIPVKRILAREAASRIVSRDSLANSTALDYFVSLAHGLRAEASPEAPRMPTP